MKNLLFAVCICLPSLSAMALADDIKCSDFVTGNTLVVHNHVLAAGGNVLVELNTTEGPKQFYGVSTETNGTLFSKEEINFQDGAGQLVLVTKSIHCGGRAPCFPGDQKATSGELVLNDVHSSYSCDDQSN